MEESIPMGFKMPMKITPYDGEKDPQDHINAFTSAMAILDLSDAMHCRLFPGTLTGPALQWYVGLKANSIGDFDQLADSFLGHFATSKEYKKTEDAFVGFQQGREETLQAFLTRFKKLALQTRELQDGVAIFIIKQGLKPSPFYADLMRNPPHSLSILLARADQFIQQENAMIAKKAVMANNKGDRAPEGKGKDQGAKKEKGGHMEKAASNIRGRSPPRSRFPSYTPLIKGREQILAEVHTTDILNFPPPNKKRGNRPVDRTKWCQFHKDHGHLTADCIQLKDQIEDLVRRGPLAQYARGNGGGHPDTRQRNPEERNHPRNRSRSREREAGPRGVIEVIAGGPQKGKDPTPQTEKRVKKSILALDYLPKRQRMDDPASEPITFGPSDFGNIDRDHDDPMVITATIANYDVKRVLVDQGSSADILYYDAFQKLGLEEKDLKSFPGTLIGFSGSQVPAIGVLHTRLTLGNAPKNTSVDVAFVVVSAPSAYNAILGRPSLNKIQAIVSTAHLLMKFPTKAGVGQVRADQKAARACYAVSLAKTLKFKGKTIDEPLPPQDEEREVCEIVDLRDEMPGGRPQPTEDLANVRLYGEEDEREARLGTSLDLETKQQLEDLLRQYRDVFAWTTADMPGIDPNLICHSLNTNDRPGVIQKKRRFGDDRQRAIDEEVQKLLTAGFIRESKYPTWLSNVVMVKKANGKWRMCVDFTDLNKACPKDAYPLPNIDRLVDETAGHRLLSFLDAFSGYNQIRMNPRDEEKTSFITEKGVYCYKVMPSVSKMQGQLTKE